MAVTDSILAFNAGEISPLLEGRFDLDKYKLSCRTLENFRPTKYGAATKRAGTEFINEVKDSADYCRLFRFQFSTDVTYCIEAGDQYFRFYKDGAVITTGTAATTYEISTPWSDTEVFDLHYAQINDVVYFVHPDFPPYKLSRTDDDSWTLAEVVWKFPPLRDVNITSTTITPSAKTGTGSSAITLTASSAIFQQGHVGSYWYIEHKTKGESIQLDLSGSSGTTNSSAMRMKGKWQLTTSERWYGTLTLQRSYNNSTWEDIREFKSESDRNVLVEGDEEEKCYLRLKYVAAGDPYSTSVFKLAATSGTASAVTYTYFEAKATLEAAEQFLGGVVEIKTVNTAGTSATADVLQDLEGTTATTEWYEPAWSDVRGYPRAVAFFEQRLVFASSDEKKQTMWFSQTDDFENFEYGSDDTDAMAYTIGSTEYNEILWLVPHTRLIVGTTGGEYAIGSTDQQSPLSPTNVLVRKQSNFGSSSLQAVSVNDVILFVQRQGRKIRELAYSFEKDSYVAPDLTILSEHITEGGVTTIAYQQQPDALLWLTRADGTLIGMTYERDENVVGWFRYVTDGEFESVVTLYGDDQDEVWVVVKRTIDGSTKRYIERFAVQDFSTEKEDLIFLDSSLSFDGGAAKTITGLTNARPPVVTAAAHGFLNDYNVRITGTGTELDGKVYTVKNKATNTLQLYLTDGTTPEDLRVVTQYTVGTDTPSVDIVRTLTLGTHHLVAADNVKITPTAAWVEQLGASFVGTVTTVGATTATVSCPVIAPAGDEAPISFDFTGFTVELADGATAYVSGGSVQRVENTFTNLSHLEGETVHALVDGATTPSEVVSSGAVTFDDWGNKVHVGLPFEATLKPQRLEISTPVGTSVGKTKRISEATLRLYKTLSLKIGESSTVSDTVIFRATDDETDASPDLFTGDKKIYFRGGSNKTGDIVLVSDDPLPCTVLGIFPKVEVT